MINSIAVPMQELETENRVIFKENQVITKSSRNPFAGWLAYTQASGTFVLTKPGIYRIHYNANVTSQNKIAARLAIYANGEVLEGSQTEHFVSEPTLYESLSATALVRVAPYDTLSISLVNISEEAVELKEASIIIDKVA